MCGCLLHASYRGSGPATQACDRESNLQPCGSQAGTQSTEPHQPGPVPYSFNVFLPHENVGSVRAGGSLSFCSVLRVPCVPSA